MKNLKNMFASSRKKKVTSLTLEMKQFLDQYCQDGDDKGVVIVDEFCQIFSCQKEEVRWLILNYIKTFENSVERSVQHMYNNDYSREEARTELRLHFDLSQSRVEEFLSAVYGPEEGHNYSAWKEFCCDMCACNSCKQGCYCLECARNPEVMPFHTDYWREMCDETDVQKDIDEEKTNEH